MCIGHITCAAGCHRCNTIGLFAWCCHSHCRDGYKVQTGELLYNPVNSAWNQMCVKLHWLGIADFLPRANLVPCASTSALLRQLSMICRKKAQRGFGARYPIATLQLVVYVYCCYSATLPCLFGGSQRHGTAISAGKHLCCSACVTSGVAWKPRQISSMNCWKAHITATSWLTCSCKSISTLIPCSALTLPGPALSRQPANGLQVNEATALCPPDLHRECCSVCQSDVLHHAKRASEPEAL